MTDNCVFCEITSNDPKDQIITTIKSGNSTIGVFEPLNPCVDGHLLFVPNEHVENSSCGPSVTGDTVAALATYATLNDIKDYNIIVNCGKEASQSVGHLHVHLVPRNASDDVQLPWPQHQKGTN